MDPKELALQHFEKAVLALFGGWLIFTAYGMVAGGGAGGIAADVEEGQKAVAAHMATATQPDPTAPSWVSDLKQHLDPASVAEPGDFAAWTMHRRPAFLFQVRKEEFNHAPHHYPPVDVTANAEERGKIDLRWEASIQNEFVLTTYEVWRREGGDGEWEKLAETDSATKSYTDDTISSRAEYYYKIVSVAELEREHPLVRQYPDKMKLPEADVRKESNIMGPVGTKREVFVFPSLVDPVTFEEERDRTQAKPWADVLVYKWDPETATFLKKQFRVFGGDEIGEDNARISGGRRFDFRTRAILSDVRVEKQPSRFGAGEETVYVMTVQWPDGSEEEVTSRDKDDFKEE